MLNPLLCFLFFNDTYTTEIYTYCHPLSLHVALPISEIASLVAQIDGLHRQLAANDRETEQIGRTALSKLELDGQRIEPLDAAREVLAAGEEATWLQIGRAHV